MPNPTSVHIKEQIIKDYLENSGTMELSEKYQLNRSTIQRILKANNIPLRKTTTKNKFNIHFFDTYTRESCYWAGFIAADGNVSSTRNNVNIHLSIEDYAHLKKFAKEINFTGNLEKHDKDCRISIAGSFYKEALAKNFDIFPQKTKTIKISEKIPEEFIFDFLRGYFDGDGCITQNGKYPHISFTSGSLTFLQQLQILFYNKGIIIQGKNKIPPISNNTAIHYNCANAMKILDMLYEHSTEETRLSRKYDKYIFYKG